MRPQPRRAAARSIRGPRAATRRGPSMARRCYHPPQPPLAPPPQTARMLLHAATVFLSAFLLFLVQPILAKQILPWFGGAAIVWTLCMVFFQLVLLLGYAYAHWLARLPGRRQARIHIA